MKANQFADWTDEEFSVKYSNKITPEERSTSSINLRGGCPGTLPSSTPSSVDHTVSGGVNPVRAQGTCGSCWAFSSTASMEFCHWKATNELRILSQQQLVDCATFMWGNNGCKGGWPINAFKYVKKQGQTSNEQYPYKSKDGKCTYNKRDSVSSISGHQEIEPDCPTAVIMAVAQRVVSVTVDSQKWKHYSSGIMTRESCGLQLDHAVNIVGYGVGTDGKEQGQKFLKVRNSWSNRWGEQGYIRLSYNLNNGVGTCGILMKPAYPTC